MNQTERTVAAATRAYGEIVREIRPLELTEQTGTVLGAPHGRRPHGRGRRRGSWLTPAAAAATVIALAVTLVIVRDAPNRHGAPATATVRVPRYYVTLDQLGAKPDQLGAKFHSRKALQVSDTRTGARLVTVAPPKGSTFFGATAAADDQTFVVDTLPFGRAYNPDAPRTWYLLRIALGTAHPAVLTKLAIPKLADVNAIAVSGSGRQLAVATGGGDDGFGASSRTRGPGVLRLYSVPTGRLLRTWTSTDHAVFGSAPSPYAEDNAKLSWVKGDRALAFSSIWTAVNPYSNRETLRMLDVSASGGDLLTASRIVWRQTSTAPALDCYDPMISPDGKTVVCELAVTALGSPAKSSKTTVRWLAYRASASAPTSAGRVLYQVTVPTPRLRHVNSLWTMLSGNTVLAQWYVYRYPDPGPASAVHFGVIRDGRFTPLPSPTSAAQWTLAIAR